MIPQRITLVTLGARDLPNLRAFYQRLGWEDTPASTDDYCVFTTAGVLLSLYPYAELAKDAGLDGKWATEDGPGGPREAGDAKPSFRGLRWRSTWRSRSWSTRRSSRRAPPERSSSRSRSRRFGAAVQLILPTRNSTSGRWPGILPPRLTKAARCSLFNKLEAFILFS